MAYTRQTYKLFRFQTDPTYNSAGAVTAVNCEAFFKRRYVNDSDPEDVEESQAVINADFDLLANPSNQTTVAVGGGVTVTDAQLAALIRKRSEAAIA